jgi:hypothetical protein
MNTAEKTVPKTRVDPIEEQVIRDNVEFGQ